MTGGRLTTVALANVPHLDVHQEVQETLTSLGPGIVYSRLLRLRTGPEDTLPQPSLLLECDLCESWQMRDPLTYLFQLREGIQWQDIPPVNGRELVAEDIVFSYQRLRSFPSASAALLQNVATVEAEDDYTLKISLTSQFPDVDFLVALADGHTKVVAREAVELHGDLKEGPVVGTGPWVWKSTNDGIGSVVEKNHKYFEEGLPFLDELVIQLIRGAEENRVAAFVTGAIDTYRVAPETWDLFRQKVKESNQQFESFLSRQGGSGTMLLMNASAPPFDNIAVRRAVLSALDPWVYVEDLWEGQGYVSLGMPVRSADWLLTRQQMRAHFADPASSAEMLSSSGVSVPVKFDLAVGDFGDIHLEQGRRIQSDLRAVGLDAVFTKLNPPAYADRVWGDKNYQLAVGLLPPGLNTTNSFLFSVLHSAFPQGNVIEHSDDRLDEMILEQANARVPEERRELLRDLQRYLLEQAYMFAPVTSGSRWVSRKRVKGFYPNTAALEYLYWAKTWVE